MGALAATALTAATVAGAVSSVVGGWSLVATAVNNDGIWAGLPVQLQDAIRNAGMAPGR